VAARFQQVAEMMYDDAPDDSDEEDEGTLLLEPEPEPEPEPESKPLTDDQVVAAFELYDANRGKLREDPEFKDCVPGTFVDHFRMCELEDGVLDRYQALKPKTISVFPRGGAMIEIPWHKGMSTKEVKEGIQREIGVHPKQQRLMHGETELKAMDRESGGWHQLPDSVVPGETELQLVLGLFAKTEGAARIGFAVDLSGSMGARVGGGHTRMSVVNQHLTQALEAHQRPGNYFSIATFGGAFSSTWHGCAGSHAREYCPRDFHGGRLPRKGRKRSRGQMPLRFSGHER
jgi:hypothetical protein